MSRLGQRGAQFPSAVVGNQAYIAALAAEIHARVQTDVGDQLFGRAEPPNVANKGAKAKATI